GREWAALRGHTGSVEAVAFSPDGRILATASYDMTVKLWDVARPGDPHLAVDPITGYDGAAKLWDTGTARGPATLAGHTGPGPCGACPSAPTAAWSPRPATTARFGCGTSRPVVW